MTRIFLFGATALLVALPLFPTAAPAATLDDCFQQALKQSETLAEDHEAIAQAREQYHEAIAAVLPNVGLNYDYLRQDDHSVGATTAEFNPVQQNTATLTLTQPLFQGFSEYAALRDVKDNLTESKDAHRWAAMQIYQDVAQAFFQVLSLENSRELLNEQIKDYAKELKEEKYFYAIGRARNSDLETVAADEALLRASVS
ncbi:MAG: TolC family protein, partial [bacterium]